MNAKNGLLAHLGKEDKELSPKLRKAAQTNEELARTLSLFAKDMQEITEVALDFSGKYHSGGSGIEFAKYFGQLFSVLKLRLDRENSSYFWNLKKLRISFNE